MARYIVAVIVAACLSAVNGAAESTSQRVVASTFNPKYQSPASLQDDAAHFFAAKSQAIDHMVPKTFGRQLMQSTTCGTSQKYCAGAGCIDLTNVCCNDGSGACPAGWQCVPGTSKCARATGTAVTCNPGYKPCDNKGCIPISGFCCNDGTGSYCTSPTPVCVPNSNKCKSAGNMAQAKIGMVLISLATFVLGMLMI